MSVENIFFFLNTKQQNVVETYMSITSLTRTLTATSIDGFPLLLLNLDETVIKLAFGDGASEQTAAITSHTSAAFRRKSCCSLITSKSSFL